MASMTSAPARVLPLEGASNFRDLGGYPGHGGRPVRWRTLFRSDHLGALTPADFGALRRIGLARALDFRGATERAAAPYELPGIAQYALEIEPTVVQRMQDLSSLGQRLSAPVVGELMRELYRGLVNDQSHRYAELFAHLIETDGPLVFHCTAGKDRTGLAAALVLFALGVPREIVMQDYLLTNEVYLRPPLPADPELAEALAVLWRVEAGFLEGALQAIDRDHGGVERFLEARLGLDRAARDLLAQRYLEGASR